jgi:hypothetical protein
MLIERNDLPLNALDVEKHAGKLFVNLAKLNELKKSRRKEKRMKKKIGVDLDGTLASYDHWRGAAHIGKPIPRMYHRVFRWIAEGHTVVIFTARANTPENIRFIKHWLKKWGFPDLQVTNVKLPDLDEYWDDRAIQVVRNTGFSIEEKMKAEAF